MKPKMFIGSSVESLDIAYAIQENLEHNVEITVWTQDVFDLTNYTLDSLLNALNEFDYALFVLTPDDIAKIRKNEQQIIRDNVIFELGLFIGRLGKERIFLVKPRGHEDFHLPTDLLGLTPAEFDPNRDDKNLNAALGPACNKIRKVVQKQGIITQESTDLSLEEQEYFDSLDANDIVSLIESWMGSRAVALNTHAIKYIDVDKEINLPSGSSEKYIEVAARRWGYVVARKGKMTILFRDAS